MGWFCSMMGWHMSVQECQVRQCFLRLAQQEMALRPRCQGLGYGTDGAEIGNGCFRRDCVLAIHFAQKERARAWRMSANANPAAGLKPDSRSPFRAQAGHMVRAAAGWLEIQCLFLRIW